MYPTHFWKPDDTKYSFKESTFGLRNTFSPKKSTFGLTWPSFCHGFVEISAFFSMTRRVWHAYEWSNIFFRIGGIHFRKFWEKILRFHEFTELRKQKLPKKKTFALFLPLLQCWLCKISNEKCFFQFWSLYTQCNVYCVDT